MNKAALSPDHYIVHVDYAPLPSMKDLEQQFSGEDSVSIMFDGRPWENHESCKDIDQTPGDRDFLVKRFNECMESESVIDWASGNGYRVATHQEAIAFAAKNPDLQREFCIIALGSCALDDDGGDRFCAALLGRASRLLDVGWFDYEWSDSDWFLLVRK